MRCATGWRFGKRRASAVGAEHGSPLAKSGLSDGVPFGHVFRGQRCRPAVLVWGQESLESNLGGRIEIHEEDGFGIGAA